MVTFQIVTHLCAHIWVVHVYVPDDGEDCNDDDGAMVVLVIIRVKHHYI